MQRNKTTDTIYIDIISESRKRWNVKKLKVITEDYPTISQIQEELLKLARMSDWKTFIESQQVGECQLIAQSVSKMFPKMKFYSVIIKFSNDAIEKMKTQTDPDMFTCHHYLNICDNHYFDFGKATNRYEGIYVLDGIDNMFSCLYSNEALKHIVNPIERSIENPII